MKIILSEQQPIATGATADVYAWGEGRILKLYREGFPPDDARREAERARLAFASGLSMPAVIDVVAVEGRQGVVYERVEGVTMLAALLAQPERCDELAEQMAALHVTMHGCSVSGLPSQRKRLTRAIRGAAPLSETTKQAMLIALDRLPDDGALCHGDFHPGNILLTANGPVIIDWMDVAHGHPLADVARSRLLIEAGSLPEGLPAAECVRLERLRQQLCAAYLRCYRQLRPFTQDEIEAWLPPVAAARLDERIRTREEVEALLQMVGGQPK